MRFITNNGGVMKKMVHHFKCCHALFNGLAFLLVAAGMIVGPILENSTLVACLAAVAAVVQVGTILNDTSQSWK